jgi:hypothetical protein
MSTPNLSSFVFRQFRHRTSQRLSLNPTSEWFQDLYSLGELYEARILAAYGSAIGFFPSDEVENWLQHRAARLASDLVVRLPRRLRISDTSRLPSYLDATELLRWAIDTVPPSRKNQQEFQSVLMLREYLEERSTLMGYFNSLLLFASSADWQESLDRCYSALSENNNAPAALVNSDLYLVDGAYYAALQCREVLAFDSGHPIDVSSPWYELDDRDTPYESTDLLTKAGDEAPDLVRMAIHTIIEHDHRDRESAERFVRVVFRAKLLERISAAAHGHEADVPRFAPEPVYSFVGTEVEESLACALSGSTIWATMLWRLAPSDPQSRSRYSEAAQLVHYFLATSGVIADT